VRATNIGLQHPKYPHKIQINKRIAIGILTKKKKKKNYFAGGLGGQNFITMVATPPRFVSLSIFF
jgi:hypothetical protein